MIVDKGVLVDMDVAAGRVAGGTAVVDKAVAAGRVVQVGAQAAAAWNELG